MIYYIFALGMTFATAVSALNTWLPIEDDYRPSEHFIRGALTIIYGTVAIVLWVAAFSA